MAAIIIMHYRESGFSYIPPKRQIFVFFVFCFLFLCCCCCCSQASNLAGLKLQNLYTLSDQRLKSVLSSFSHGFFAVFPTFAEFKGQSEIWGKFQCRILGLLFLDAFFLELSFSSSFSSYRGCITLLKLSASIRAAGILWVRSRSLRKKS